MEGGGINVDRLTIPDKPIEGGMRRAIIDARAVREEDMKIYWALKKYEDTGLMPEEIMDGQMLTGWIPVEEKLPEVGEDVLVTIKDDDAYFVSIDTYRGATGGEWDMFDGVIAWMSLPEPYRPSVLLEAGKCAGEYADAPTLRPAT